MTCMSKGMVGSAMARKPKTSHAGVHQSIAGLVVPKALSCLVCCALWLVALVCVVAALVAYSFLANVAVFWLVYHPFHVVDAPVECLGVHLLLFWFIFGWYLLPFLLLSLEALSGLFGSDGAGHRIGAVDRDDGACGELDREPAEQVPLDRLYRPSDHPLRSVEDDVGGLARGRAGGHGDAVATARGQFVGSL